MVYQKQLRRKKERNKQKRIKQRKWFVPLKPL